MSGSASKCREPVYLTSIDVAYSLVGGSDYAEIVADNLDVFLIFDNDNRRQSFDVTIIDDSQTELDEKFTLELRVDPFSTTPSNVILSPNTTTVDIIDNEGTYDTINTILTSLKAYYDNSTWGCDWLSEHFLYCE